MGRDTSPRGGDETGFAMTRLLAHVDALFEVDARGRLRAEPTKSGGTAPRFYLGRTRLGNIWRARADIAPEALRALSRLAAREPALPFAQSVVPPAPERLAALWAQLEAGPIEPDAVVRGPVYAFTPASLARDPGAARLVSRSEDPLATRLREHFPESAPALAAGWPCAVWCSGDEPTSICFSATVGRGEHPAHEARVITSAASRGRRQASAVVAAWARVVTERGDIPLYATPWSHRAALRVAAHLGLALVAEDLQIA